MLIKCPECQENVSDTAKQCPHCGYCLVPHMCASQKITSSLKAVKNFFCFTKRKRKLTPKMSPLQFFVYASHNVWLDQQDFKERERDYTVNDEMGCVKEDLVLFAFAKIISKRILIRLTESDPNDFEKIKSGDGVGIIDERDIDPYVENLTPFFKELFAHSIEIAMAANNRESVYNAIEPFVSGLLLYEDIEYRYGHKLITENKYYSQLETLVGKFLKDKGQS